MLGFLYFNINSRMNKCDIRQKKKRTTDFQAPHFEPAFLKCGDAKHV